MTPQIPVDADPALVALVEAARDVIAAEDSEDIEGTLYGGDMLLRLRVALEAYR